jgi:predicted phosphodiesterase
MSYHFLYPLVCLTLCASVTLGAPEGKRGHDKGERKIPVQNSPCNDVPAHPFDIILGRPTRDSVTASVLAYRDTEGCLAYGRQPAALTQQTPLRVFKRDEPAEIVLGGLRPDTQYFYQLRTGGTNGVSGTFRTQRPRGSAFTFTITADSHLDEHTSPALLQRTLANAHADKSDFHLDLGDTFMTEKHARRETAYKQYLAQRFYFGQLCSSAPLFFVLGNHDGENPRGRGDETDSLAVWSCLTRKKFFPNPVPDSFFSGNAAKHPEAGLLQDYYAWEWGDALFVVLDPFWYTQRVRGQRDNWKRTLGTEQYQWLKRTLEGSSAKFKFVFIHHLVGGVDEQARGGSEAAPFFEWGGKNIDGTEGFKEHRAGWPLPIHQLLLCNRVNIVFHGHDHLFAKQELDGLIYQECPQPGAEGNGRLPRYAEEYGYKSGTILGSSGHMRVDIAPQQATITYVRSDGSTAHTYTVSPSQ